VGCQQDQAYLQDFDLTPDLFLLYWLENLDHASLAVGHTHALKQQATHTQHSTAQCSQRQHSAVVGTAVCL
jgi:hypothetical protein